MNSLPTILFAFSCAFLLYVIAGYPLLLKVLARQFYRPINKGDYVPSVAVVIPVRNGAQYVRRKLDSVLQLKYPRESIEVLVISDGSTDETDALVGEYADHGVRLLRVPHGGKPAALNAGVPTTRNTILLLTDIRQVLEPESLRKMVSCFADPEVGVVSGELLIRRGENSAETNIGLYWRFETWIRNRLSDIDSMLGATGPFYAIRRELMVQMPPETLLDDLFVPLAAFFRGFRLVVEPDAKAYDDPTSLSTEFRRKVRTLAGNYQIMQQYPALLTPSNRMWIHYVSYKLGRLLLPFALITIAITSFWLPFRWMVIAALSVQAAVYSLSIFDHFDGWLPEQSILKRLSSLARTFVVMMLAAFCALSIFFVPPQKLWTPTKTRANNRP
jgi:cellulose synthase/poly-beta-1,6-N-acetylglucosamine synthase-like glycosyltransferase